MNEFNHLREQSAMYDQESMNRAQNHWGAQEEDSADIMDMFRAVWRRKLFILVCVLLTTALFYLISSSLPNLYTARATLILDSREQQVISSQEQVVGDLELNNPIIESEIAVLRSRTMLERVVEELGIDRFNGIDPANSEPSTLSLLVEALKGFVKAGGTPADAEVAMAVSPEERRLNRVLATLREGLDVYRVGNSYVMEIIVVTSDPVLSADVANALAKAYIDAKIAGRQRVVESATRWLSDQVEQRRLDLAAAEARVDEYKRGQLEFSGTTREMIELQLPELNRQLTLARADLSGEEARLEQIEALLKSQGHVVVAETFPSPFLTALRVERETLLREDARLAASLGSKHPDRRVIETEVVQIEASIQVEVDNIVQTLRNEISILRTREASLASAVEAQEKQLSEIARLSLTLRQLESDADVARSNYETLLARLGETRAQSEIQRSEAQIVTPAIAPTGPSSPRVRLMAFFGVALGLTGGLIAALVMELMHSTFKRASDLERTTQLPVLTVLPKHRMRRPVSILNVAKNKQYSLLSERIRALRTVLSMSSDTEGSQSILLLSSVAQEGKTTTSLALATFYARTGASVVLVDLDTRRSTLQALIKTRPEYDLSDYLCGHVELSQAISRPEGVSFDLATTSRWQALMADHLAPQAIQDLVQTLKSHYSVVIIDAPPVLAVSDGIRVAPAVDHVLYMVRWGRTPRRSVQYGLSALAAVGLKPSGLVMTMAEASADPGGYAQTYTYE